MQRKTVRYHHTLIRMDKLKNADNVRGWQGRAAVSCKHTLLKGGQTDTTLENSQYLLKQSICIFKDPTTPFLGGIRVESAPKDMYQNVHRSTVCNISTLETTQIPFNSRKDKLWWWNTILQWEWTTTTISEIWMNFLGIILSDISQTQEYWKLKNKQS